MKIIECPRDAMQGLHRFIPTAEKIEYLKLLLNCGFDTLDFTSFVSPKAIPQMADAHEVYSGLEKYDFSTRLLAIVANIRGAEDAAAKSRIDYIGFPLSLSETFQMRNTRKSIAQALEEVSRISELCEKSSKTLVVYLSMGFGNPYGDPWNREVLLQMSREMARANINIISLSDTTGTANDDDIQAVFKILLTEFPGIEFGAHFHAPPGKGFAKIQTAYNAGCRRFDGALLGYGGCPMAADSLTGNIDTADIIRLAEAHNERTDIDPQAVAKASAYATALFNRYRS